MKRTIDVIIVNWNTRSLLKKCLASVRQAAEKAVAHINILVVDNGSTDGSVEMIMSEFKGVQVIKNETNLGFARANNIGINNSRGEFIFLLNSDTEVEYNIFDYIVNTFEKDKNIGIIGCKLVLPNGKRQVGDAGFRPSFITGFNFAFFLSKLFPFLFKGLFLNSEKGFEDVDWVSGAALAGRRAVFERTGGLPDRFFMYAEDLELGLMVKEMGLRVCYCPNIRVIHYFGGSASQDQEKSVTWINNLLAFVKEHNSKLDYRFFCLSLGIGFLIRSIIYSVLSLLTKEEQWRKKYKDLYKASGSCF